MQITTPNFLAAYGQGVQLREAEQAIGNRNALTSALQAGDMGAARNAFAAVNPEAAYAAMQPAKRDPKETMQIAGQLTRAVLSAPPEMRNDVYAEALSMAGGMGLDISGLPEVYDEQSVMVMDRLFNMQDDERTEFERQLAMIPEGPERERAVRIALGLAPKAEAPNARQPASVQEFEYARQNGFTGSYQDFLGRKTPSTTVNVGAPNVTVNGPNTDKFSEETAKILAKEAGETVQVGNMARANLRALGRLSDLLAQSPQGVEGALVLALGEIGIPTEGLDAAQAARALINKMVPEQRAPGTGPMSDADLALFKESVPRIINQPGGNAIIIDTLRKIAEYDVQRGDIARQLQLGRITYDQAAEQWNALSDPLEEFRRDPATPPRGLSQERWDAMSPEDRALFK